MRWACQRPSGVERAVGDVTLRLAVADQANLDRCGDALAELTGELLARRHGLAGELLGATWRCGDAIELLESAQRRPLAGTQHEGRLVAFALQRPDRFCPAPRVLGEVQRRVVARDAHV